MSNETRTEVHVTGAPGYDDFDGELYTTVKAVDDRGPLSVVVFVWEGKKDIAIVPARCVRRRYITEAQAGACLAIVRKYTGDDSAALYGPGHEGEFFNISLEGGMEEWAIRISQDDTVVWPEGVWVEPVASWCLALLPKT